MKCLDALTDSMDMNLGKLWEMVRGREAQCYSPWGCKESDTTWRQKNDNNKMTLPPCYVSHFVGNLT